MPSASARDACSGSLVVQAPSELLDWCPTTRGAGPSRCARRVESVGPRGVQATSTLSGSVPTMRQCGLRTIRGCQVVRVRIGGASENLSRTSLADATTPTGAAQRFPLASVSVVDRLTNVCGAGFDEPSTRPTDTGDIQPHVVLIVLLFVRGTAQDRGGGWRPARGRARPVEVDELSAGLGRSALCHGVGGARAASAEAQQLLERWRSGELTTEDLDSLAKRAAAGEPLTPVSPHAA